MAALTSPRRLPQGSVPPTSWCNTSSSRGGCCHLQRALARSPSLGASTSPGPAPRSSPRGGEGPRASRLGTGAMALRGLFWLRGREAPSSVPWGWAGVGAGLRLPHGCDMAARGQCHWAGEPRRRSTSGCGSGGVVSAAVGVRVETPRLWSRAWAPAPAGSLCSSALPGQSPARPAMGDCKNLHEIFPALPESSGSGLHGAAGDSHAAASQLVPSLGRGLTTPGLHKCSNHPGAIAGSCQDRHGRRMLFVSVTANARGCCSGETEQVTGFRGRRRGRCRGALGSP